ncbi:agrin-like [Paramuricea clavata]|uniref:Agrin-like n=1 Tax=Paramuricea clavata TaxID=317549 RepID=A0A6S7G2P1_PARCT|nr:agrin-like [Paramuricea clavata]
MISLRLDVKKGLLFSLACCFVVSRNGVFPSETGGICKDYWPTYCKVIKDSCGIHRIWMRKYCPDTCGICKEAKHVNPCQYTKCPYHSRCIVINLHSAKCLCQNLFDCSKQHSLVCGTDKVTYRNNCTLKAIACRLKKNIRVHSTGYCKFPCAHVKCRNFAKCQVSSDGIGKCKCPSYEQCLSIPRPICGKDGVTYYNQCFWKVKSCKEKTKIPIARHGRCAAISGIGTSRPPGEPNKESCQSNFCPYYMLCREVNGVATCVKICPQSSCSCVYGVEYYQHRNGCLMCRCKLPYLIKARN